MELDDLDDEAVEGFEDGSNGRTIVDPEGQRKKYLDLLEEPGVMLKVPREYAVWNPVTKKFISKTLTCWHLNPNHRWKKNGLGAITGTTFKFQRIVRITKADGKSPGYVRPIAYRTAFLEKETYNGDFWDPSYTVSHLCHDELCFNPKHHVLEKLEVNKSRNGCAGGDCCLHEKPCLVTGPYADANGDGVPSAHNNEAWWVVKENEKRRRRLIGEAQERKEAREAAEAAGLLPPKKPRAKKAKK